MLEANPRASRTIPFVSKAIGVPLAKVATKVMLGKTLKEQGLVGEAKISHYAVKASVFPFLKLPGVDSILGPEMKSTGEVMGIDKEYGAAMWKAMIGSGMNLPLEGEVYISVRDADKAAASEIAKELVNLGFRIIATKGTAAEIRNRGIPVETVFRVSEKLSPDALTLMRQGRVKMIINTPTESSGARRDGYMMRRLAVELQIPFFTTLEGARAAVEAIRYAKEREIEPVNLKSIVRNRV
jgi:carbamoyl-phosphate synthase large subunit